MSSTQDSTGVSAAFGQHVQIELAFADIASIIVQALQGQERHINKL